MTELYNPESLKVPCDEDDYDYNLTCTDLFLRTKIVYDGDFFIAIVPKGTVIYTGTLAQNEMLLYSFGNLMLRDGPDTFDPEIYAMAGPSWFSNLKVAARYAHDKTCPECIYSYKLKRDLKLIVLSNAYNLAKLAFIFLEDKSMVAGLYFMFDGLEDLVARLMKYQDKDIPNWLTPKLVEECGFKITRNSEYRKDFDTSFGLLQYFMSKNSKYRGYMSPTIKHSHGNFHEEIMIFNPPSVLKRNYSDPHDASNKAAIISPGPVLQAFQKRYDTSRNIDVNHWDNTKWDYTVWTLLYTEKIIERYKQHKFLNISPSDTRFIAFVALIHEVSDDYEDLAHELGVTLDKARRDIIRIVQDRHTDFEAIVDIVSKEPSQYLTKTDEDEQIFNVDIPLCDDFKSHNMTTKCNKKLEKFMEYIPEDNLVTLLNKHYGDLDKLQLTTLIIISIAHVLGLTPFGRGRLKYIKRDGPIIYNRLKHLVASSHYFPIRNQYRSALGEPNRSMLMRKIGIIIGEIALINL